LKILLTGKTGQLGWELARTLAPLGELTAVDRHALDLSDSTAIASTVRQLKPNLIVNAAAYTAVDRAQTEIAAAHAINATAPEILAREARALGAALVHFSTDYVFDGKKNGAYEESDTPAPGSVYGQSKLAGEEAIAASGVAHLVLRTSWVYAARGSNFLLTMLRLARTKPELAVVADQFGAPTWARMIAEATALILARCGTTPQAMLEGLAQRGGIYHLSAAGRTSWHGFAEAIVRDAGLATPVRAITTADYPLPAPRPAISVLANEKLAKQFGVALPDWETGVRQCIEELVLRDPQQGAPVR
jgi:dTDP-4-dehydrorhamnose reductase